MGVFKELRLGGLMGLVRGIGAVSWVEPATTAGAGLLILVSVVLGTVLGGISAGIRQGHEEVRFVPHPILSRPRKHTHERPAAQRYDVLLSHNRADKEHVRLLKEMLEARGIVVWYDENQLIPGHNWQPLMENGIEASASGAVVVGLDGLGPWENEAMQVLLRHAVETGKPVIPVLLPRAPRRPSLPLFLGNRTWVDCRPDFDDENIEKLVWGITGKRLAA